MSKYMAAIGLVLGAAIAIMTGVPATMLWMISTGCVLGYFAGWADSKRSE